METVILTLEVTPELDKALQEIAKKELVTKEDIARGIIATTLSKANRKPTILGFDMDFVAVVLKGIGDAIRTDKVANSIISVINAEDILQKVFKNLPPSKKPKD